MMRRSGRTSAYSKEMILRGKNRGVFVAVDLRPQFFVHSKHVYSGTFEQVTKLRNKGELV